MAVPVPDRFADELRAPDVRTQVFADDGTFPNNETLPVLVLGGAIRAADGNAARTIERVFRAHDWRGSWRDGIFS